MPRSRPPDLEEFRRETKLVRGGRSVRDVAESLGCSKQALHVWVKQHQLDHRERDDGLTSSEREELRSASHTRAGGRTREAGLPAPVRAYDLSPLEDTHGMGGDMTELGSGMGCCPFPVGL